MPWNSCPRSRGTAAHHHWNTHQLGLDVRIRDDVIQRRVLDRHQTVKRHIIFGNEKGLRPPLVERLVDDAFGHHQPFAGLDDGGDAVDEGGRVHRRVGKPP